ncbi:hypothetical protein DDB_G0291680 [Dictyostelium discoideum AX4]|uniref:Uncharacterized protein n=1 Tax=Dictyostelium discoideum TaxID=44689 RepID=Q54EE1_DICDI|nr:hypothetical protein DDB_G0291680 [Dictyostelium discoideum AX4]EAL61824.1 hypothetical protein DDB_G0291680 [Dictyostelium discoideum AX4]|eukprot:XP_635299.1 hypothetical protein DDB_G0291680 [Dictyostelium discoideum AX4]
MDNNYNKYSSGQSKIISDFDKIQDIFEIVLKNHVNNQSTQDNNNIRILDIGCSHGKNSIIVLKPLIEQLEINGSQMKKLLNVLHHRYNELKVGGIFSFNLFIQEDQGSENEEKSKSMKNCTKKIKEILREMSYESILSREEVENMIVPAIIFTRNEYQYAIDKSTNNTGLKLIYESRITSNWYYCYQDDESYISSIIAFIGNFIKNAINGDKNRVDSIFNDFEQRLHLKYKSNPKDFQFHVSSLYLSFLKEN